MGPLKTLDYILNHPLNRGRPVSTIARYLGWQVGSRLAPGPVRVPFVDDLSLIVSPGMVGATGNIYCGLHEFEDMGFALHLLRRGDLFVDVGANIGSYSILAGATGADVIAFEPGERFADLKRNADANGLAIDCRCEALGAHTGTLRFTIGLDSINRAARGGEAATEVPMTTLDASIERVPTLIKIDVEGYEAAVVEGGKRVIPKAKALIIEMWDSTLVRQLNEWGFRAIDYDPLTRTIKESRRRGNAIFVRGDVAETLATAPRHTVRGRII